MVLTGQRVLDVFIFCIYLFPEKSTSKAARAAAVNTKWEIPRAI
jgi:hypothetical protein